MSDVLTALTEMINAKIDEADEWDDPNYASAYRSAMADCLSMIEELSRKDTGAGDTADTDDKTELISKRAVIELIEALPVVTGGATAAAEGLKDNTTENKEPDFFADDYEMSKTPYASEKTYQEPKIIDPEKRVAISNCPECGRYIPYGTPFCPHCRHMLEWR